MLTRNQEGSGSTEGSLLQEHQQPQVKCGCFATPAAYSPLPRVADVGGAAGDDDQRLRHRADNNIDSKRFEQQLGVMLEEVLDRICDTLP